jgi:large subunit ribosomal protein L30
MKTLKLQLKRSGAGRYPKHRKTLLGLGLTHIGQVRELPDTPQVRGMINQVCYLVEVVTEGARS